MHIQAKQNVEVDIEVDDVVKLIKKKLFLENYRVDEGILKQEKLIDYHNGNYDWVECEIQNEHKIELVKASELLFAALKKYG